MVTKEENPVTLVALVTREDVDPKITSDSTTPPHTDREVNTAIVLEKPSEDGYNWRKYGQKNVKGNEYIRSYYKCSNSNCNVKKQVERSQDGRITDVTYLGNHDHDIPHTEPEVHVPSLLSSQVQIPACPPAQEEKPADVLAPAVLDVQPMNAFETLADEVDEDHVLALATPPTQQSDDHHENWTPKKRKKVDGADITPEKSGHESRFVVQTVSEVDIVNDGYRWRKYGQKMVKGNSYPRSYYRCSTSGCPAKKHVERASYDPKVVITTYEHQHDHNLPPLRTIVQQSAASSGGLDSNGQEKPKSEEIDVSQNALTKETGKTNALDPAAMEKNNLSVVKTQNEELSGDQNLSNKANNEDHSDRMVLGESVVEGHSEAKPDVMKSEDQVQDPPCVASVDVKPEVLPTEQKRTDALDAAVLGSTVANTASNGEHRMNSKPVNC